MIFGKWSKGHIFSWDACTGSGTNLTNGSGQVIRPCGHITPRATIHTRDLGTIGPIHFYGLRVIRPLSWCFPLLLKISVGEIRFL